MIQCIITCHHHQSSNTIHNTMNIMYHRKLFSLNTSSFNQVKGYTIRCISCLTCITYTILQIHGIFHAYYKLHQTGNMTHHLSCCITSTIKQDTLFISCLYIMSQLWDYDTQCNIYHVLS